ncbi:Copia protein [Durusdinium trenchii]|uniref:Copia protein n=1 Tax=Durusdinium trenchii TaxID=1381693 RepID=A0ABP0KW28_9DINO
MAPENPEDLPQPPEEEFSAEDAVRARLRDVRREPKVQEALEQVEDFRKVKEGEFSLAPHLRREVHKVHRNLGHPAKEVFLRAMRHSGVKHHVLDWVRHHFRCPACQARERPNPQRPGHLLRALEFGQIVGLDLLYIEIEGELKTFLNMLDWGTNFQQAALCQNRTAQEDSAPPSITRTLKSPWQNSRTERAGGVFKEKFKAVYHAASATKDEVPMVVAEVAACRNRFMDRWGFSPMQRVFGKTLRMPASLLSSDVLDQELMELAATDPIRRQWKIQELASQEWLRRQDRSAIQRSVHSKARNTDKKDFKPGQWAYVFRSTPQFRGWAGPGVLLTESPSGTGWWMSMRGRLWQVSTEQLRHASPEENLGAELVLELFQELLERLKAPGQVAYQDVTQDEIPNESDFQEEELLRLFRIEDPGAPSQAAPAIEDDEDMTMTESTHLDDQPAPSTQPSSRAPSKEEPSRPSAPPSRGVSFMDSAMDPETPQLQDIPEEDQVMESAERTDEVMREEEPETPSLPSGPPPELASPIRVDEGSSGSFRFGPAPRARDDRPTPYPFFEAPPSLPRPPGHSLFVDFTDFDKAEDLQGLGITGSFVGATWRYDREQRRQILQPHKIHSTKTFWSHSAEASFDYNDRCVYVSKAKSSFGQVEFSKLPEETKVQFRASRKKEMDSLIKNQAVRILSVEESLEFARLHPSQIIDSKFVDRYKPKSVELSTLAEYKRRAIQEGHLEAIELEQDQQNPKSRLCAVGWLDPQIHEVERSAPTPLSASIHCCLQLSATRRWKTKVKDVKTAFLQSLPTTRSKMLACRQPKDEPLPGCDPRQLILLLTEIYGLVSGPSWWRRTLLKLATEELHYKVNEYDKCVLTLPAPSKGTGHGKELTAGYMVIEVDDIIEAGGPEHQKLMAKVEKLLTFGKIEELYSSEGTSYAGRYLRQLEDYSFVAHMEEFIYTRLEPITMARKVLKKDADRIPLNEKEKTQLRGLIASLNWVARESRPDAAAGASILASAFPEPKFSHILQANDLVRHLKTFPLELKIHAIEESKLRHFLIADSAFDMSGKEKSQFGFLMGFTTPA